LLRKIETTLTKSVEKRLMADVPFGVLLSGGLDSSLIASITSRLIRSNTKNTFCNNLHSFSIGLENSPDLLAARKVADFLGTIHHELNFTVQDGIDAIRDLIYHLETFDVTTIRASTPMFLMSRKIKSHGIKMVLSGEGADEVFGGYLYFHKAPNDEEFHEECKKRVSELSKFDCLRANKSTMAWGLEARVPFLDKRFLELCIPIHSKNKLYNVEKYVLRKAFDNKDTPYLPDEILWRQKEQFTDGVGYNWLDSLVKHCNNSISDEEFSSHSSEFKNKEEMYYKKIFDELFPNREEVVDRWIPKTDWDGVSYDPSGRAQSVHVSNGGL
jgi:asparagine synthase (glutamine-hydrolysing)